MCSSVISLSQCCKKTYVSPGMVAKLVGMSSHKPKGCRFNSWSGHMPRLWVWSLVGAHTELINWYFSLPLMSLSLSFCQSLRLINISSSDNGRKEGRKEGREVGRKEGITEGNLHGRKYILQDCPFVFNHFFTSTPYFHSLNPSGINFSFHSINLN